VVVTIIALLATLVAPRLLSQVGKAKKSTARAKAATVAEAVNLYLLDMALSAPSDNFDLQVLLMRPDDGGGPTGPYLERAEDLLDPWDNPFIIVVPGEVNASFDIVSYGEDGQPGGEGVAEDITQ
jgi:general secretion pathway protein G